MSGSHKKSQGHSPNIMKTLSLYHSVTKLKGAAQFGVYFCAIGCVCGYDLQAVDKQPKHAAIYSHNSDIK